MPANTSPDNIVYPVTSDQVAPLETVFANMATSIQNALANYKGTTGSTIVANQAGRDALFPAPVQGNRVYRTDLGFEEGYRALYNLTTNPGGANPAGWYPTGGSLVGFYTRPTAQSVVTSGGSQVILLTTVAQPSPGLALTSNRVSITYPGIYMVTAQLEVAANGSGQRNITVGGTGVTRLNVMSNAGAPNGAIAYTGETTAYIRAAAGASLEIQLTQNSGSTLAVNNTSLGITFVGVPKF